MPNDGSHPVGQQPSQESAHDVSQGASQSVANGVEQTAERSGEDARRRGWFWHWNTIITQYAPLVGLKGVGLLNSYTVWTDRREESPHHGYAFPSQQSEADFYGEDRAELITINKILVTLGLIEIRKEMVLRVDERGRRWKVPHNLYRVRDHQDGYNLSVEDVLKVVELASRDRAVYRYIRRVFSPRFTPIDGGNVWHQMLPALRQSESWRELEERAVREEARASARTKAGHAKRSKPSNQPTNGDAQNSTRQERDDGSSALQPTHEAAEQPHKTSVASTNHGSPIDVDVGNNGSRPAAEQSNTGFVLKDVTIADQRNEGGPTGVDQANTTYYEGSITTTTTTLLETNRDRPASAGAGPLPSASDAVVACFEAANNRDATPLEIELLAELEATFTECAHRTGDTGAEWVVAAIREAVGSGSRFVAPKRVREILNRWSKQSDPVRTSAAPASGGVDVVPTASTRDFRMPDGRNASDVWERTLKLLSGALDPEELERLLGGSRIIAYRAGTITVDTAGHESAERLSGEYYELVSRKLAEAMRRSVRIEFVVDRSPQGLATAPASSPDAPEAQGKIISFVEASRPAPVPTFTLSGGLSNQQVWSTALESLSTRLTAATLETWLRPASIIGLDADGTLILGAPNAFAQRRLSSRLQADIVRVVSDLLGRDVQLRVVVAQEWLRQQASSPDAGDS